MLSEVRQYCVWQYCALCLTLSSLVVTPGNHLFLIFSFWNMWTLCVWFWMTHTLKLSAIRHRWRYFVWASMWHVTFALLWLPLSSRRARQWTRDVLLDIWVCAVPTMLIPGKHVARVATIKDYRNEVLYLHRKWPPHIFLTKETYEKVISFKMFCHFFFQLNCFLPKRECCAWKSLKNYV